MSYIITIYTTEGESYLQGQDFKEMESGFEFGMTGLNLTVSSDKKIFLPSHQIIKIVKTKDHARKTE